MSSRFKNFENQSKNKVLMKHYILVALIMNMIIYELTPVVPKFLDLIIPLNDSRQSLYIARTDYSKFSIDQNKHFWLIYLHQTQSAYTSIFTLLAFDTCFVMVIQNAISMFVVLG